MKILDCQKQNVNKYVPTPCISSTVSTKGVLCAPDSSKFFGTPCTVRIKESARHKFVSLAVYMACARPRQFVAWEPKAGVKLTNIVGPT